MTHWATEYIGKQWAYGAKGPETYDCWNFVTVVMKDRFGITMPVVEYKAEWKEAAAQLASPKNREDWIKVAKPQEGDVVLMARARLPVHIGLWINANNTQGILHCLERMGVHFTQMSSIRASGWGSLEYYRHILR